MNIVIGLKKKNYLMQHQKVIKKELANAKPKSDHIPTMPPLDCDEEVTEGKGIKILTPNKL